MALQASTSGENPEIAVVIEEPVEATAQSTPAESPVDSQLPHLRIPKVPEGHGYGGRDAYEPTIISIGPYHHGKPRLLPMELLKRECFDRVKNREREYWTSDDWFSALYPTGKEARRYYAENTDNINGKDFLEMMMLDACFIIEYCACIQKDNYYEKEIFLSDLHEKKKNLSDLLKGRIWVDTAIRNDLLLLENQIPLFFVMKVFSFFQLGDARQLMASLGYFFRHVSPINTNKSSHFSHIGQPDDDFEDKHLLYFYHSYLFSSTGNTSPNTASPYAEKPICTIRSATFLEEAGIELEKVSYKEKNGFPEEAIIDFEQEVIDFEQEVDSVMNVTFQNGIMKITPLFIDAFTVSQFRNLIALEKHYSYLEPQATAFAQFMDYIINTSKDVDLLRKKGILEHSLGSDEEIATIFNQLTSGILEYRTLKMETMYKRVDEYCKTKHHLWWAILMKNYFGNPWTAISLVAAVILLSLTFIQTFFSMYSYFRPPSAK